jgi:hypothetical protein
MAKRGINARGRADRLILHKRAPQYDGQYEEENETDEEERRRREMEMDDENDEGNDDDDDHDDDNDDDHDEMKRMDRDRMDDEMNGSWHQNMKRSPYYNGDEEEEEERERRERRERKRREMEGDEDDMEGYAKGDSSWNAEIKDGRIEGKGDDRYTYSVGMDNGE